MANKLLFTLLMAISNKLSEQSQQGVSEELPKLLCETLEAQGCAVYIYQDEDYFLHDKYASDSLQFADYWKYYRFPFPATVQYIDNQEQVKSFFRMGTDQRCLLLPLMNEKYSGGVVLVLWTASSPLDDLSTEEMHLFQPISQLLADIYCTFPFLSKLKQREKALSALYQKAEQELENSRKQVSLELHDEVGQVLTSIMLQLKLLQQSQDFEYVKGRLGGLHHITLQTLEEVRRISHNLRPNLLEKLGLKAALEAHIKEYIESTGIVVEFKCHNLEEQLPGDTEIIVYRAVQEGLTNIARHAEATTALINVTVKGNNLLLQISDNGKGMAEEESHGLGLLGMKERVRLAKGKFWLLDQKGQGLTLNILLPLS